MCYRKAIITVLLIILSSMLTITTVNALPPPSGYPQGCTACSTPGSGWCAESGSGYQCVEVNSSLCGGRLGDSNFCPTGCRCGRYAGIGNSCGNSCIIVEWCPGEVIPTPVPTAPPEGIRDAACVSNTIPAEMAPGESRTVTVTMKNTGTLSWLPPYYRLGEQPDFWHATGGAHPRWGIGRVELPLNSEVRPGEEHEFEFTITAPNDPGSEIDSNWRMLQEYVEWFGPTCGRRVSITDDDFICPPCSDEGINMEFAYEGTLAVGSEFTPRIWGLPGSQGHTWIDDVILGGSNDCIGMIPLTWEYREEYPPYTWHPKKERICTVSHEETITWTHSWHNGDPLICEQCTKSISIIPGEDITPTITPTPATTTIKGDLYITNERTIGRSALSPFSCLPLDGHPLNSQQAQMISVVARDNTDSSFSGSISELNSDYTINTTTGDDGNYMVELEITDPQYECICPNPNLDNNMKCSYTNVPKNYNQLHFFIRKSDQPIMSWWQASGSHAYAGQAKDVSINSPIPTDCQADDCEPVLIRARQDIPNTPGFPMTAGGVVDVTDNRIHDANRTNSPNAKITELLLKKESGDFNYFTQFVDYQALTPLPADEKPPSGIYKESGDLTIDTLWEVLDTEEIVVFIEGDLIINNPGNSPIVTVEPGGFLLLISRNNIIIDADVGYEVNDSIVANFNNLEPLIQGVFVADQNIFIQGDNQNDKLLVAAGSYVAWEKLVLNRTLGNEYNHSIPSYHFIFRPDFITNWPESLKRARTIYQEISPTTN